MGHRVAAEFVCSAGKGGEGDAGPSASRPDDAGGEFTATRMGRADFGRTSSSGLAGDALWHRLASALLLLGQNPQRRDPMVPPG